MLLFLMLVSYHIIINFVKLNDQTTNYVYFGTSIALPFFIFILYLANKGGSAAYNAASSAYSKWRGN
jgi:hypothetical protein